MHRERANQGSECECKAILTKNNNSPIALPCNMYNNDLTEAITQQKNKQVNKMTKLNLEVKKIGRSFCVVAGVSVLGKFRNEESAAKSLVEDFDLYSFWAGSAGVSVENTPAKVVLV